MHVAIVWCNHKNFSIRCQMHRPLRRGSRFEWYRLSLSTQSAATHSRCRMRPRLQRQQQILLVSVIACYTLHNVCSFTSHTITVRAYLLVWRSFTFAAGGPQATLTPSHSNPFVEISLLYTLAVIAAHPRLRPQRRSVLDGGNSYFPHLRIRIRNLFFIATAIW